MDYCPERARVATYRLQSDEPVELVGIDALEVNLWVDLEHVARTDDDVSFDVPFSRIEGQTFALGVDEREVDPHCPYEATVTFRIFAGSETLDDEDGFPTIEFPGEMIEAGTRELPLWEGWPVLLTVQGAGG